MNATTLKKHYEVQLEEDLKPPVRAHVDRRATRCMLYISRRMPAGELKETNAGRIWIWSDLHLGHTETISSFARPFASSQEMDDALFRSWHRTVSPGDTIICLGDIAIHGLSGTLLKRLRRAPGRKILVIGNHEINRIGEVDIDGFEELHSTLYAAGDPPLLLTPHAATGTCLTAASTSTATCTIGSRLRGRGTSTSASSSCATGPGRGRRLADWPGTWLPATR